MCAMSESVLARANAKQRHAPLFRPARGNARPLDPTGRTNSGAIDRVARKRAAAIGLAAAA